MNRVLLKADLGGGNSVASDIESAPIDRESGHGETMKAMVCHRYGSPDVLQLEEIPKPIPGKNEVLIEVRAASVNAGDWHLLRGTPWLIRLMFGFFKPKCKVLGSDVAGRVEAVGEEVTEFKPGDEVFADVSGCGFGAFAEYVRVPEKLVAPKSSNLSYEEAAAVPAAAVTALQALRDKGEIGPGKKVLINGASGGVGTFAVQIAKAYGAEVTAVCSTAKVGRARSIGADHVVDYTQEDFTKSGRTYDLILAANGHQPISAYKRALAPGGRYVMTGGTGAQMFQAMCLGPWISMFGNKKMGNMLVKPNQKDLVVVKELIEGGKISPVIDRRYPLIGVPDAIRYLEEGHAAGKVVIEMKSAKA